MVTSSIGDACAITGKHSCLVPFADNHGPSRKLAVRPCSWNFMWRMRNSQLLQFLIMGQLLPHGCHLLISCHVVVSIGPGRLNFRWSRSGRCGIFLMSFMPGSSVEIDGSVIHAIGVSLGVTSFCSSVHRLLLYGVGITADGKLLPSIFRRFGGLQLVCNKVVTIALLCHVLVCLKTSERTWLKLSR